MEKDNLEQNHNDSNQNLKRQANEDVLEISSTGYGLEAVSIEAEEEQKLKENNSSCGGL